MIVRVQGSGQYRLAEAAIESLRQLDHQLVVAIHAHDERRVQTLLDEMIGLVQAHGSVIGDAELLPSDVILPPDTLTTDEVQALLHDDSLVGAAPSA